MMPQTKTLSILVTTALLTCSLPMALSAQPAGGNDPGLGVTVQLPTLGVSIDTAGILTTKIFPDAGGELVRERLNQMKRQFPQDLQRSSKCRKISLKQLQRTCAREIEQQNELSPTVQSLAGLTRIEYVFLLVEQRDIVIAGPAEPWIDNAAGRAVGIHSGQPILKLEDLAVAIRCFPPSRRPDHWVACSIDPTAQGIQRLNVVNRNLPKQIGADEEFAAADYFREQMKDALGLADVKVYGIAPETHAAKVMVEADYRMKLMAVGLEDPVVRKLTTFIEALKGSPKSLQRWWLTPEYKRLKQATDGLTVQFVGRGVSLKTENVLFDKNANVQRQSTKPSRAARIYSKSFTRNYDALAQVKPVFAQLRNVMDCLVAAAWIRHQAGWNKCELVPEIFLDETRLETKTNPAIEHAQCVANAVWKQNVLLLPAGGGVSITPTESLEDGNLRLDKTNKLQDLARSIEVDQDAWWWD